jgi:integrase
MAAISKRGSTYQVKIRRNGVRRSATFRNRAQAEQWARKIESEIDANRIYPGLAVARTTTLADALDRYAKDIAPKKKGEKQALSIIRRWKKSKLAHRAISEVRPADIAEYRDELAQTLGPQTIRHHLNLVGHLYRTAAKEWGFETLANPVAVISKPKLPQGRNRRLTEKEEKRLLAACDASQSSWLGTYVRIALFTAMRQSEILNLDWRDINLQSQTLLVRTSKNDEARTVPFSKRAASVFKRFRRKDVEEGRVFNIATGRAVTHAFAKVCNDGNFADLRFHDLRHEATSRLFERTDLREVEIAAITGHKSSAMLWRYTHLRSKDIARRLK